MKQKLNKNKINFIQLTLNQKKTEIPQNAADKEKKYILIYQRKK